MAEQRRLKEAGPTAQSASDDGGRLAWLENELHAERRRLEQLQAREGRLANQLHQATIALGRVEAENARLRAREAEFARMRDAQYWLDIMMTSRSLRLTAPLRRAHAHLVRLRGGR